MQGTSISHPTVDGATHAAGQPGRRVVDAPTRMFHWLFALSFAGAYASGDSEHWRALHVTLGYTMAALLAFRLLYGLVGPRHARLGLLWRRLGGAPQWLRSLTLSRWLSASHWRQGQNLLMALAVAALLGLVLPLALSGYATYNEWDDAFGGEWFEALHEFFANAVLLLVMLHLGLIAVTSLLRRRNQAQPMITGRIAGRGPDLAKRDHRWLAVLLLIAALGFGAWQWQQSPRGLVPAKAWSTGAADHHRHHDDDRSADACVGRIAGPWPRHHQVGRRRRCDLRRRPGAPAGHGLMRQRLDRFVLLVPASGADKRASQRCQPRRNARRTTARGARTACSAPATPWRRPGAVPGAQSSAATAPAGVAAGPHRPAPSVQHEHAGVVGMTQQQRAHALLPQRLEQAQLLVGDGTGQAARHQRRQSRIGRHALEASRQIDERRAVQSREADLPGDVRGEEQPLPTIETPTDAFEAGVLGGAGEQADDVGNDAVHAVQPFAAQLHEHAPAFGQLVRIQRRQRRAREQEGRSHRRA
jgi:cytochrome b